MLQRVLASVVCLVLMSRVATAQVLNQTEGNSFLKDYQFTSGETLSRLRIHYHTLGKIHRNAQGSIDNAVLLLHGTSGSGMTFLAPDFADAVFGPGGVLDATHYFIVLPDAIGHGKSSKPSDGARARFPHYGYRDILDAEYRAITTSLKVDHLRLVMGMSMGGMQTWMWGEKYPDFMDALVPFTSLPAPISGRNRIWRRIAMDAIRQDPAWNGGNYLKQPPGLRVAEEMLFFMMGSSVRRQAEMPTLAQADAALDAAVESSLPGQDANDLLYALAASEDYNPGPGLEQIRAPLLAINFADDLINPPELGILEREIKRVPQGRALLIPAGPDTDGHGSPYIVPLWKDEVARLLSTAAP